MEPVSAGLPVSGAVLFFGDRCPHTHPSTRSDAQSAGAVIALCYRCLSGGPPSLITLYTYLIFLVVLALWPSCFLHSLCYSDSLYSLTPTLDSLLTRGGSLTLYSQHRLVFLSRRGRWLSTLLSFLSMLSAGSPLGIPIRYRLISTRVYSELLCRAGDFEMK